MTTKIETGWGQRIAGALSPNRLSLRFQRWLDFKMKAEVTELKGQRIVHHRSLWSEPEEIGLSEVRTWRIVMNMGFDIVLIEKPDGSVIQWEDKYDDLISILRGNHPDKELPWTCE